MTPMLLFLALGWQIDGEYPDEPTTEAPSAVMIDAMPEGPSEEVYPDKASAAAAMAMEAAERARIATERADDLIYWESARWSVRERDHDCLVTNRSLWVSFDYRLSRSEIGFADSTIKSLRQGETRTVKVWWLNGKDGFDGGTVRLSATPIPEHAPTVTLMKGRIVDRAFLDSFARMTTIGFITTDGVVIDAWSLAGSALAVKKLRECATLVSIKRPSDPFSK